MSTFVRLSPYIIENISWGQMSIENVMAGSETEAETTLLIVGCLVRFGGSAADYATLTLYSMPLLIIHLIYK